MRLKLLNSIRDSKKIRGNKNDFWLVSYPRSGNTWLRLILANYIWNGPQIGNLQDLQTYVADIHYQRSGISPKKFSNKHRIIKSHEQYRDDYLQLIYVYRKPFDCAWSYFHFMKDWKSEYTQFDEFVTAFLNGKLPFGSWHDHLVQWQEMHKGKHIYICYEELLKDPKQYLKEIIAFVGLVYNEERVEKALAGAVPEIVAQITNDELFYGKEFKTFVKSPFGIESETKEKLRSEYAERFQEWDKLFFEFKNG